MYYVPCIKPGSPSGDEASWVGLGGVNNSHLVQTGTESDTYYIGPVQFYNYYAWTENVAASNDSQVWLFSVNCGDRIQVYAESTDTITHDWTNGNYNTTTSSPSASNATAEWIVERVTTCNLFGCTVTALPNFQSETFYGMGTTLGNGNYVSPHDIDHVYSNMNGLTGIGGLSYNIAWGPPDYANTITWV